MNKKISRTIKFLIISDFFLFFALGLLSPIFAVFILKNIENKIEVVGYAVAFYWITRVLMVVPISRLMDKIKGEMDEYSFMVFGTFLVSILPLFYIMSSQPWHIYVLQVLNGVANAMVVPAWRIIFTNHIDKKIVGFEWSLEDVGVGIATASSAAIGALIVGRFGFSVLFEAVSLLGIISTLILLPLGRGKKIYSKTVNNKSNSTPLKIDTFK